MKNSKQMTIQILFVVIHNLIQIVAQVLVLMILFLEVLVVEFINLKICLSQEMLQKVRY